MTDEVLVSQAVNYSVNVYHLPRDADPETPLCGNSGADYREYRQVDRDHPAARDRRVCKTCRSQLDETPGHSGGGDAECPFCGAEVSHLPPHLPCDGSAGAAEVLSVDD